MHQERRVFLALWEHMVTGCQVARCVLLGHGPQLQDRNHAVLVLLVLLSVPPELPVAPPVLLATFPNMEQVVAQYVPRAPMHLPVALRVVLHVRRVHIATPVLLIATVVSQAPLSAV